MSYGFNRRMIEDTVKYAKVTYTAAPSRSMYIGSKIAGSSVHYIDFYTGYPKDRPYYVHNGRANFLMLDFHVESRTLGMVPDSSNYYTSVVRKQFWFHYSRK